MDVANCVITLCVWVIPVACCDHLGPPPQDESVSYIPSHSSSLSFLSLDAAPSWSGGADLTISWYLYSAVVLALSNAEKGGKKWSMEKGVNLFALLCALALALALLLSLSFSHLLPPFFFFSSSSPFFLSFFLPFFFSFLFSFSPWDNHWFLLLRNARDTCICHFMHMKGRFLFCWPWRLDVTMQDKHS